MTLLLALLACSGTPKDTDTNGGDPTDGGSTTIDGGSTADGGSTSLNGSPPDEPLAAPEFVATNRDGTGRSREDLLGHPTVMWFYPAASTAG